MRGVADRSSHGNNAVVALCDKNIGRVQYYNRLLQELGQPAAAEYTFDQFEQMLEEQKVEVLVVTTVDATHHEYIIPALKRGIKVITEKPMTTTIEACRSILDTVKQTDNHLTVTFNYRYNPVHEKVKNLIQQNAIGKVLSVHFEWLLDTAHGADYFRRWHRFKSSSGGLMVHKSGHHFDLVNWWLASTPTQVVAMGQTGFYGKGKKNHTWAKDYERALGSKVALEDPFALKMEQDETLKELYVDNEKYDNYERDRNVFNDDVAIEDDVGALVRYKNGAIMTYHLTAYSPWEGYRVMFNGTGGRLELEVVESAFRTSEQVTVGPGSIHGTRALPNAGGPRISLHPLWQPPQNIEVEFSHEGHGGGDKRLLSTIFGPLPGETEETDPASQMASTEMDGAWALAVGLAANESFETGKMVDVEQMLNISGA